MLILARSLRGGAVRRRGLTLSGGRVVEASHVGWRGGRVLYSGGRWWRARVRLEAGGGDEGGEVGLDGVGGCVGCQDGGWVVAVVAAGASVL